MLIFYLLKKVTTNFYNVEFFIKEYVKKNQ